MKSFWKKKCSIFSHGKKMETCTFQNFSFKKFSVIFHAQVNLNITQKNLLKHATSTM